MAVHGVEYAFGAHEYPTTGIFEAEPKQCDGFTFRKSILIGKTELGPADVRGVMEDLAEEYKGNAYNLITKNCNHFCNDACIRLTGNPIPSWVNRLARIGNSAFSINDKMGSFFIQFCCYKSPKKPINQLPFRILLFLLLWNIMVESVKKARTRVNALVSFTLSRFILSDKYRYLFLKQSILFHIL